MASRGVTGRPLCWLAALGIAAALWLVYLPGLSGPFLFDDLPNFLHNRLVKMDRLEPLQVERALRSWGEATLPDRALARLTFALNHLASGGRFDAHDMKATNLAIHGVNVLLVGMLCHAWCRRLRRAPGGVVEPRDVQRMPEPMAVALLAAALWALHPIQLTPVLYVVQRMTGLSATFVLLGLLCYGRARAHLARRPLRASVGMLTALGGCVILGYFCKQNAVLLVPLAFLCERTFFRGEELGARARRALVLVHGLTLGVPLAGALLLLPELWDWLQAGYVPREFDMVERVLTQARVLMLYLGLLVFPYPESFTLWHDGLQVSTGLLAPPSTATSVAGLSLLVAAGLWGVAARRVWAFALLFFLLGHLLESSVVALEMVFEHRNYLPSAGLAFAAAWYLLLLARRLKLAVATTGVAAASLLLLPALVTHARAMAWSSDLSLARHLVYRAPASYRSHQYLGDILQRRNAPATQRYEAFRRAAVVPGEAVVPVIRMRRMVAAMQYRLVQGDDTRLPGDELPRDWSTPLAPHPAFLSRIDVLLDEEVTRRLVARIPHAETVAEFDRVERCLRANLDTCWRLRPVLRRWIETALTRGRPYRTVAVRLHFLASSLAAQDGDYEQALRRLYQAEATHGSKPAPRHLKAIYLARLGRFDEAGELLAEMDREGDAVREGHDALARARRVLERVRARAGQGASD
jgi:hypothetical protein